MTLRRAEAFQGTVGASDSHGTSHKQADVERRVFDGVDVWHETETRQKNTL